jgi:hypothetical protein
MPASTIPYSLTQSLSGYWTLDEASGGRADSTGLNNLSLVGSSVGSSATSINGNSALFTGTAGASSLQSTTFGGQTGSGFSFSCWIRPTVIPTVGANANGSGCILRFGGPSDTYRLALYVSDTNRISFLINEALQGSPQTFFTGAAINNWYHVVVSIDPSGSTLSRLYVNNAVVSTFNSNQWNLNFLGMIVGANATSGATQYNYSGIVDELACWNRPITQTEVSTLWNNREGYVLANPYYAHATATLSTQAASYNGGSAIVTPTVITVPSGLSNTVTYTDSGGNAVSGVPQNVGNYFANISITDSRYTGVSFQYPFRIVDWNSTQYGTQLNAYWKMDESSGTRTDATGNGYAITETGGSISSGVGIFGNNCASFPTGNSRYLTTPASLFDVGTSSKTFSMWFRLDRSYLSNIQQWLVRSSPPLADGWGWRLYISSSGGLRFSASSSLNGATWEVNSGDIVAVPKNQWHHVAVVFSQNIYTGNIRIFFDGSIVANYTYNGFVNETRTGYALGHSEGAGIATEGFHGLMDEIGTWGRALSDQEVINLYNGGCGFPFPSSFASTQFAKVTISNTGQNYTGSACPVTITTVPPGLSTSVTYTDSNGATSNTAPSDIGLYTVNATVTSSGYSGNATSKLSIFSMPSSMARSLAGYWRMTEANGNRLDSVGGSPIVETGGIVSSKVGINNTSAYFSNSANSWLTMPAGVCDTNSGPKSVSFWVYIEPSSQRNAVYFIMQGTGIDANDWVLYLDSNPGYCLSFLASHSRNSWDLILRGNQTYYPSYAPSSGLNLSLNNAVGAWHHVALTIDGSRIKAYFDNTLVINSAYSRPITSSGSSFTVGKHTAINQNFFMVGQVQDLAVWNRGLSTDEVGILYNNGCGSPFPSNAQFSTYTQVSISNLSQLYTGNQSPVTVTTVPSGVSVITTYTDSLGNSSTTPPTNVGAYDVSVVTNNSAYNGSATGQLVITQPNTTIQNGLHALWRMSETSGSRSDSTSNNYTLSQNGANAISSAVGRLGNAASFPGTVGHFLRNDSVSFSQPFSVSCWISPRTISTSTVYQSVFTLGTISGKPISVVTGNTNQLSIYNSWNGTYFPFYYSLSASTWTHIALVFAQGKMQMYVNGNIANNGTTPYVYQHEIPIGQTLTGLIAGSLNISGAQAFNGLLDELCAWNRTLSAQEVRSIYNSGFGQPFPDTLAIVPQANVIISDTAQDYTGSPCPVTITTVPSGLTVEVNYTDSTTGVTSTLPPTNTGSYEVSAVVVSNTYVGSATDTLIITQFPNSIVRNSLAYWRMEELTGLRSDSTGNGYGLSETRGPIYASSGIIGRGAIFSGDGGSPTSPCLFNTAINPNTNFTVSCWINADVLDNTKIVWCLGTTSGHVYRLRSYFANGFYFDSPTISFTDGRNQVSPAGSISTEQWYHSVIVFSSSRATCYMNGVLINTITIAETTPNSTGISIGWDAKMGGVTTSTFGWNGVIDEFTVWSRGLSAIEVNQLYNSGRAMPIPGSYPIATNITVTSSTNVSYTGSPIPVQYTLDQPSASSIITYQDSVGNTTTTPPTNAGSYTYQITVTDNGHYGSTSGSLTINKASATVTLSDLSQTYNASQRSASATVDRGGNSTPMGPNFGQTTGTITYKLVDSASAPTTTPPTNAGTYSVVATLVDSNWSGSATGNLVIAKATPTITITNTSKAYNGIQQGVTVTTSVPGLNYNVTYDDNPTVPSETGTYSVLVTINDSNSESVTQTATLTISAANAYIAVSNLTTTYNGSPQQPRITVTNDSGGIIDIPLSVIYNESSTTPSDTGTYSVVITSTDLDYNAAPVNVNFTIVPRPVVITLSALNQIYNGNPLSVVVSTSIPDIDTSVTYTDSEGTESTNPPTSTGQYQVSVSVTTPNHTGSASAVLTVYATLPFSSLPNSVNYVTAIYNSTSQKWHVMNFSKSLNQ